MSRFSVVASLHCKQLSSLQRYLDTASNARCDESKTRTSANRQIKHGSKYML